MEEEEEEVYTRPLPLTPCQEDRLGLDYTGYPLRSCAMADLVYQFGRTRSWKECSERIFSGCPYGDTTTRVSGPWLVAGELNGSAPAAPCSGDCVDSTAAHVILYCPQIAEPTFNCIKRGRCPYAEAARRGGG